MNLYSFRDGTPPIGQLVQNANEVITSVPAFERHFFFSTGGRKGQKLAQKDITYLRSPAAVLTVRVYLQSSRCGGCRMASR